MTPETLNKSTKTGGQNDDIDHTGSDLTDTKVTNTLTWGRRPRVVLHLFPVLRFPDGGFETKVRVGVGQKRPRRYDSVVPRNPVYRSEGKSRGCLRGSRWRRWNDKVEDFDPIFGERVVTVKNVRVQEHQLWKLYRHDGANSLPILFSRTC